MRRLATQRHTIAVPLRTAFLILAHDHPGHLARLVDRLHAPWSDIFIHIDRKIDQTPFEDVLRGKSISFVPDRSRVVVHWGGLSQTLAMLSLLRMALPSAERFCLLSGVDYPIKPIENIGSSLGLDRQYLNVGRELNLGEPGVLNQYLTKFHFHDIGILNTREGHSTTTRRIQKLVRRATIGLTRQPPLNLRWYHGSSWWSLTKEAVTYILDFIDNNPALLSWLRFAGSPDEIIVQSVLKNGPFESSISDDRSSVGVCINDALMNVYACHYIVWSEADSPNTLSIDDLPQLQASPALFARKFHPVHSAKLLSELDKLLLGSPPSASPTAEH